MKAWAKWKSKHRRELMREMNVGEVVELTRHPPHEERSDWQMRMDDGWIENSDSWVATGEFGVTVEDRRRAAGSF